MISIISDGGEPVYTEVYSSSVGTHPQMNIYNASHMFWASNNVASERKITIDNTLSSTKCIYIIMMRYDNADSSGIKTVTNNLVSVLPKSQYDVVIQPYENIFCILIAGYKAV